MNRKTLAVATALLVGCIQLAVAEDSKVCLSGVCLGARLAELPTGIKWEPIGVSPKNALFRGPEYETHMAGYLRADQSVLNQLKPYRDMMGDIGGLNAGVIGALQKARGSCVVFTLEGRFYSDSHHLTTVTVKPYPSADGQSQVFRVSQIIRVYTDVLTREQKDNLRSTLEGQFGVRFGAGRVLYDERNQLNQAPNIDFGFESPTSVFIGESQASLVSTQDPDRYRLLPGCTKQVKVD